MSNKTDPAKSLIIFSSSGEDNHPNSGNLGESSSINLDHEISAGRTYFLIPNSTHRSARLSKVCQPMKKLQATTPKGIQDRQKTSPTPLIERTTNYQKRGLNSKLSHYLPSSGSKRRGSSRHPQCRHQASLDLLIDGLALRESAPEAAEDPPL